MAFTEYKILHITEGGLGTVFFRGFWIVVKKLESVLNKEAADGWQLVFQLGEQKRFMLFWKRETVIITPGR